MKIKHRGIVIWDIVLTNCQSSHKYWKSFLSCSIFSFWSLWMPQKLYWVGLLTEVYINCHYQSHAVFVDLYFCLAYVQHQGIKSKARVSLSVGLTSLLYAVSLSLRFFCFSLLLFLFLSHQDFAGALSQQQAEDYNCNIREIQLCSTFSALSGEGIVEQILDFE